MMLESNDHASFFEKQRKVVVLKDLGRRCRWWNKSIGVQGRKKIKDGAEYFPETEEPVG
jgi:hypothetical protein